MSEAGEQWRDKVSFSTTREIVHIQVGQCGNQIGAAFWKKISKEHVLMPTSSGFEINWKSPFVKDYTETDELPDRVDRVGVYFNNVGSKFVPRAVLVDLEPGTKDVIKADRVLGNAFHEDDFVTGKNGAGNNWAKGHYTEGAEIVDQVLDRVRMQIEKCHVAQGFQICHSMGGGTGSGMGTLVLLRIRDEYPDKITSTYTVGPSKRASDVVVEPYNAVLSTHQLLENSDETFMIDNESLYNINQNLLKDGDVTFAGMNYVLAQVMCGMTASLRFPGKLNGDLRKLGVNLVPFPRLHFFLLGQAPLMSKAASVQTRIDVRELISQLSSDSHFFCDVRTDDGKFMASSFQFRGSMATHEVDSEIRKYQEKKTDGFVNWIPNNLKTSVVTVPALTSRLSATFVSNTTSLKSIFQRYAAQFGKLYKRKAFLHQYKEEGMDEMEFQEADKNVRDLITEYQDKEDAKYDPEEEDDEDEM